MEDPPTSLEQVDTLKLNLTQLYIEKETLENKLSSTKDKIKAIHNVLVGVKIGLKVTTVQEVTID